MATEEQQAISQAAGATAGELREIRQAISQVAQGQARLLRLIDGTEDNPDRGILWRIRVLEEAHKDSAEAHARIEAQVKKLADTIIAHDQTERGQQQSYRLEMSKAWIGFFAVTVAAILTLIGTMLLKP